MRGFKTIQPLKRNCETFDLVSTRYIPLCILRIEVIREGVSLYEGSDGQVGQ